MTDQTKSNKTNGSSDPDQVKIVDLVFTDKVLAKTKLTILYNQIVAQTENAVVADVQYQLKVKEELTFPKGGDFKKFFMEKKQLAEKKAIVNKFVKSLVGIFNDLQKEYQKMEG